MRRVPPNVLLHINDIRTVWCPIMFHLEPNSGDLPLPPFSYMCILPPPQRQQMLNPGEKWDYHGCCIWTSPRACRSGRSMPLLGTDSLGHIPWCLLGLSSPAALPLSPLAKCSRTSSPRAVRYTCHKDNTESRSGGTHENFYSFPSFCFFLWKNLSWKVPLLISSIPLSFLLS